MERSGEKKLEFFVSHNENNVKAMHGAAKRKSKPQQLASQRRAKE
jgi:hypothetical protein